MRSGFETPVSHYLKGNKMQLWLQTWQEVETYLERSTGIILPIGSTEQHGPTGLIGTDAICAQEIARAAGDIAGALVTPTISVGIAGHHMGFAGTMSHKPRTLITIIEEQIETLASHGFREFFLLNGHGGNIATIQASFSQIHANRAERGAPEIATRSFSWWECDEVQKLWREFYGDAEGLHATASEVSVTQYLFPDHIKTATLDPDIAPTAHFHGPADFRRRFPDGRVGSNPGLSTMEHGEQLFHAASKGMAAHFLSVFA